jgi:type I restriction enzyme, S subunit
MPDITRLGEVVDILTGNPFKSSGYSDDPDGVRLLRGDNVAQGRIRWDNAKRWPSSEVGMYQRFQLRSGDVILAMDRPWIEAGLKYAELGDCDVPSLLVQRTACLRARNNLNQRYLSYLIGSPGFSDYILGIQTGTAVPHISARQISDFTFALPAIATQEAIGQLLGALDDKITVNGRLADTSLALAQTHYNEAAKSTSWRSLPMGRSAQWLSGGTPSTTEPSYWGGHIPWISALSLKSPWISDSDRKVTRLGVEHGTRVVPAGTILFVVRGSSLDSEFRIGLAQRDVAFGQDCKALLAIEDVDPVVLFLAIRARTSDILNLVDHTGHGAGRLATDLITRVPVRLPDPSLGAVICDRLRHLVELGARSQAENRILLQLRNTLLPKVMSGEIRVRDAERIVEGAT